VLEELFGVDESAEVRRRAAVALRFGSDLFWKKEVVKKEVRSRTVRWSWKDSRRAAVHVTALFPPQGSDWSLVAGVPLTPWRRNGWRRKGAGAFESSARALTIDWHLTDQPWMARRSTLERAFGQRLVDQRGQDMRRWNGLQAGRPAEYAAVDGAGLDGGRCR